MVPAGSPTGDGALVGVVRRALAREGSVGVVVPDALVGRAGTELRTAGIDHVLLGDAEPDAPGTEFDAHLDLVPAGLDRVTGLRRVYVCLTRAVTSLVVLHADPLPEELGGPPEA